MRRDDAQPVADRIEGEGEMCLAAFAQRPTGIVMARKVGRQALSAELCLHPCHHRTPKCPREHAGIGCFLGEPSGNLENMEAVHLPNRRKQAEAKVTPVAQKQRTVPGSLEGDLHVSQPLRGEARAGGEFVGAGAARGKGLALQGGKRGRGVDAGMTHGLA